MGKTGTYNRRGTGTGSDDASAGNIERFTVAALRADAEATRYHNDRPSRYLGVSDEFGFRLSIARIRGIDSVDLCSLFARVEGGRQDSFDGGTRKKVIAAAYQRRAVLQARAEIEDSDPADAGETETGPTDTAADTDDAPTEAAP